MVLFIVLALINRLDYFFIRSVLVLAAILSIIDGIESYFQKEEKKIYFIEFGFAVLYFFILSITWL